MTFENKQKISEIIFKPREACHNLCPLGQLYCDELAKNGSKPRLPHYTNHFKITFVPDKVICDYLDVEKWIKENLNDETLTIEDAISKLFDYLEDEYKPAYLLVESFVNDALHGEVIVRKESD